MRTIWELCLEHRAAMPAPTAHANHVLLAIPNAKVQGLRVGDIATDVLQTLVDVWVIPFGPFCVGSGRAKDAKAIALELADREAWARITTANGLLYEDEQVIPLPRADYIAIERGFQCAEQLVRHLATTSI